MDSAVSSQAVSWWDVHEHVAPFLEAAKSWPTVGTPAWCALPDDDPRKMAALLDAARHWALRMDSCQEARCEAGRAISAAPLFTNSGDPVDWSAIARERLKLNAFFAARPWLKRAGVNHS
ncbi:MAG: DUF2742 domain-containing protein [Mycobacterium sp.]|uniref:DUF2742 domain-containing protein n=1 Tax=Mycobacterium sp. TaxID=1785 RepID=UPI003F98AACF